MSLKRLTQRQKIGLRQRIALLGQPAKKKKYLFYLIPFEEKEHGVKNDAIHIAHISLVIEIEEKLIWRRILLRDLTMSHDHCTIN